VAATSHANDQLPKVTRSTAPIIGEIASAGRGGINRAVPRYTLLHERFGQKSAQTMQSPVAG
jgi:hypothetical protein